LIAQLRAAEHRRDAAQVAATLEALRRGHESAVESGGAVEMPYGEGAEEGSDAIDDVPFGDTGESAPDERRVPPVGHSERADVGAPGRSAPDDDAFDPDDELAADRDDDL